MRNHADGFVVSQTKHQTTVQELEDTPLAFDSSICSLIKNEPHLAVTFRRASPAVYSCAFFFSRTCSTHEASCSAEGKVAALTPTSAIICWAESTPKGCR